MDDGVEEAIVETVEDPVVVRPSDARGAQAPRRREADLNQLLIAYFSNPWLWVLIAVVAFVLYRRYRSALMERLRRWQEARAEAAYDAEVKKNPDKFRERLEAIDRARRLQQERYERDATVAAAKAAEREEIKRREGIQELENLKAGKGYRNKVYVAEAEFMDGVDRSQSSQKKPKARLRPGYNPLMGPGDGGGYRPARRTMGGGGGGG